MSGLTISALQPTKYHFNGHCLAIRSERSEALIGGRDTSIRLPSFEVDYVDGTGAQATFSMVLTRDQEKSSTDRLTRAAKMTMEDCPMVNVDFGLAKIQHGVNPKCRFSANVSDRYVPQKFSEKLTLVSCLRNMRVLFACDLRTFHPSEWLMTATISEENLSDWVHFERQMHQFFDANLRNC